jgi:hypothetical protein
MGKRFRDLPDVSSGLKNQVKFENDKTYFMRLVDGIFEDWQECWPNFITPDGRDTRRFVSDEDGSNLAAIVNYKKQVGLPEKLSKQDRANWNPSFKLATIVLMGTEIQVADPTTRKPVRKIQWDALNPRIWVFGIDIQRQLAILNNNTDLIDAAIEKKLPMGDGENELLVTDVYAIRLTRTKKGGQSFEVKYDIQAGKLYGKIPANKVNIAAIQKELADHITPSKESDVENYIAQMSDGGTGSTGTEPEATEEVQGEDIDLPAPAPAKSAKAKPAPAVDDLELPDPVEDTAPAKSAKAKPAPVPAPASSEAEVDDIDALLNETV